MTDGSGNVGRAIDAFSVPDPNDVTPPVVAIATPVEDEVVLMQTAITGTVSDDNLLSYTVYLKRNDDEQWFQIAAGTQNVFGGQIGTVDGTLLVNGLMTLRVVAKDINGQTSYDERPIGVDGGAKIGVVQLSFTDMTIPVAGVPLTITRTYDSRVKTKQDFGIGWSLGMSAIGKVFHNRKPGDGWSITKKIGFGNPLCSQVTELKRHITEVRLGERTHFRFKPVITETAGGLGFCEGRMEFVQTGGTRPGAKLEIIGKEPFVYQQNDATELRDWDDLTVAEVANVRLTTPEGNVIDLNERLGVTRFQDRNGNSVEVTRNGLIHNLGLGLPFERDIMGRITRITDPMGFSTKYEYDGNGDLRVFSDQEDHRTEFHYSNAFPHHLDEIVNALGITVQRNEYDQHGRLIAVTDALQNRSLFEHGLAARVEIAIDPGRNRTQFEYDDRGNVTAISNALGDRTEFTFDDQNNIVEMKDALGRLAFFSYDENRNLLSRTNVEGDTTRFTYNSLNQVLTSSDGLGLIVRNEYDARGNITLAQDASGATISYDYDAIGQVRLVTDALGRQSSLVRDALGRPIEVAGFGGEVSRTTYDPNGNSLTESLTPPDPQPGEPDLKMSFAYSATGEIESIVGLSPGVEVQFDHDAAGRVRYVTGFGLGTVEFLLDDAGRQVARVDPDGSVTRDELDYAGRVRVHVSAEGRRTAHEFDELGRVKRSTLSDGISSRSVSYDQIGRPVSSTDERGVTSSITYGLRTQTVVNGNGERTVLRFDGRGRVASRSDALGRETAFAYDLVGRLVTTIHPDGTSSSITFDAAGRPVEHIDEGGRKVVTQYDDADRVIATTDPLGFTTRMTFRGSFIREFVDARGKRTIFEYDPATRTETRTLPLGQQLAQTRDLLGRISSVTDARGRERRWVYNLAGSVAALATSDNVGETFTYSSDGDRLSASGESFDYDALGRIVADTKPAGEVISYRYEGPLLSQVSTTAGFSTAFQYDSARRVRSIQAAAGGPYELEWGPGGRLVSQHFPAGSVAEYRYDDRDRPVAVHVSTPSPASFADIEYVRGIEGRVTQIRENLQLPGLFEVRQTFYDYDLGGRLTSERITSGTSTRSRAFTYDETGNRLSLLDSVYGLETYEYDDNGRLTKRAAPNGTTTYTYDEDGNLASSSGPDGFRAFAFDSRNRLTSRSDAQGTIELAYDADSNLTSLVHADGTSENFLVDRSHTFAQVLSRVDRVGQRSDFVLTPGGAASGTLRLGLETQASQTDWVSDAQGNLLFAMDQQTAQISDSQRFEAFGASESTLNTPFGYRGEQQIAGLDLYNLRARLYDPSLGRFLSPDPEPPSSNEPRFWNRYAYAGADPVNLGDPSGRETLMQSMVALSIPTSGLSPRLLNSQLGNEFLIAAGFDVGPVPVPAVPANVIATSVRNARAAANVMSAFAWQFERDFWFGPASKDKLQTGWDAIRRAVAQNLAYLDRTDASLVPYWATQPAPEFTSCDGPASNTIAAVGGAALAHTPRAGANVNQVVILCRLWATAQKFPWSERGGSVFSTINNPANITTTILHEASHYLDSVPHSLVPYAIAGPAFGTLDDAMGDRLHAPRSTHPLGIRANVIDANYQSDNLIDAYGYDYQAAEALGWLRGIPPRMLYSGGGGAP
ncbi:MAG: RHS repeat protein [Deltaproteobacteria bacterium]|nr:RHS repeat protein [Deltaproteobacteria bacterium]